jgi:Tol biopolymer transport system component
LHPDGSDLTDVTQTLANVSTFDPSWSPDGRWIAFASEPSGTRDAALWSVRADGSGLHELVNAPGEEEHPSWSPDGSRIVFECVLAMGCLQLTSN